MTEKTLINVRINVTKSYLMRCGRNACPLQYAINNTLEGLKQDNQMRAELYGIPSFVRVDVAKGLFKYTWDISSLKSEGILIPEDVLYWIRDYYDRTYEGRTSATPISFDTTIPIFTEIHLNKKLTKAKAMPSFIYTNERIQEEEERQAALREEELASRHVESNHDMEYRAVGTWDVDMSESSWSDDAYRYMVATPDEYDASMSIESSNPVNESEP